MTGQPTRQRTQATPLLKGGRKMQHTSIHVATTALGVVAAVGLLGPVAQASAPPASAPHTRAGARASMPAPAALAVPAAANVLATGAGCQPAGAGVSCQLWAKAGSVSLPGTSAVTAWTFVSQQDDPVTVPVGPTLVVTQGQSVDLVLHNRVAGERISLSLPQVDDFADDLDGVANGDDRTYSFTAARPGTYIYQAGGTADGTRQAAMGLVGALVVLPDPPGTAYGTAETAFSDEAVLVATDLDPALNAAPTSFDMRNFAPRYHLFNGLAYPATTPIPVTSGGRVLLRVVNAAVVQHAIGVLGTSASVVGVAARPLTHPYSVTAENIAAGDTLDAIVTLPAADGMQYAVMDPSVRLDNDGQASSVSSGNIVGFGGQLTFLQASGTAPNPGTTPKVTGLSVAPTRVGPSPTSVTLDATVTDDTSVTGVEYLIDSSSTAPGSGTAVTAFTPGPSVTLSGVAVDVSTLATGTHRLFLRGQDANGWGALTSVSFQVDRSGPTIPALTPASNAVNGTGSLAFTGSATDVGGGNVASATWSLDGGSANPLTLTPSSGPTVSLTGTIPAATMAGLSEGQHSLVATGTDDLGNVGSASPSATFLVDRTAPTIGTVTISPSPNDGTQGVAYDATSIEVRASFSDPGSAPSGVSAGEGFLTTAGSPGTGFPLVLSATSSPATLVATVPLSQLNSLPDGNNQIWVRAKDKAGNWGTAVAGTLVLARPTKVSVLSVTPNSTATAATAALAATATAPAGTTVTAAEYFVGTDPGPGNGTAMTVATATQVSSISATINLDSLALGARTIGVRARNSTGNWGPVVSTTLTLSNLFADGFEAGSLTAAGRWNTPITTASGGTVTQQAAAAMTGALGLRVTANSTNSRGYLIKNTTAVPVFRVRFQFNPATMVTGGAGTGRWTTIYRSVGTTTVGGTTERFRIEYSGAGTTRAVRMVVDTGAGATPVLATSTPIAVGVGTNVIEVDWASAASATAALVVTPNVGAASTQTLTALNTNNRTVTSSQLGLSLAPGSGSGTFGGNLYFDAYNSSRYGF